ncbi:MAG: thioesterase family protein [Clostridiales bacterium]|nr:thioesterase family protein [Clostridiales bacterium]
MIKTGLVGKEEAIVSLSKCAREMSSGDLDIFATPSLVALMEASAINCVKNKLGIGETTVGISVNVKHTSPTPTGMTVWAESELTEIDGRRLTFKITAYDKSGVIGTATHERMIVEKEKMLEKANSKMNK